MDDEDADSVTFVEHLQIEVLENSDGRAVGRIVLKDIHSSNPNSGIAHGGVPYALADHTAGAAVGSLTDGPVPTIDMRMEYLRPTMGEYLEATAEVVRAGTHIATADVDLRTDSGDLVARAHGTFKFSGQTGDSPWEAGGFRETFDEHSVSE